MSSSKLSPAVVIIAACSLVTIAIAAKVSDPVAADRLSQVQEIARVQGSSPAYTMLVIFSPTDCGACLNELNTLDQLARDTSLGLQVIGVAMDLLPDELMALRASGIRFPILAANQVGNIYDLGVKKGINKPVKVVLDSIGEVIRLDISGTTIASHVRYANEIRSIIQD